MSDKEVRFATHYHLVGRYPGWWRDFHRLPKRLFKALSGCDGSGILADSSTYRCGGSAG